MTELTYGIRVRMTGDQKNFDLADEIVKVLCPSCRDRWSQMSGRDAEKHVCPCGWDGPFVVVNLVMF